MKKATKPTGRKSNPEMHKVTLHIHERTHQRARLRLLGIAVEENTPEKDLSTLVDELPAEWIAGGSRKR